RPRRRHRCLLSVGRLTRGRLITVPQRGAADANKKTAPPLKASLRVAEQGRQEKTRRASPASPGVHGGPFNSRYSATPWSLLLSVRVLVMWMTQAFSSSVSRPALPGVIGGASPLGVAVHGPGGTGVQAQHPLGGGGRR